MHLPREMFGEIQSEIIDVHGYLTLAVYIHYFLPGSVKIHTKLRTVKLGQLSALIDPQLDIRLPFSRRSQQGIRWLPKAEMPYPGFCRSPGSGECLEVLCNCKALDELWAKYKEKLKVKQKMNKKYKTG